MKCSFNITDWATPVRQRLLSDSEVGFSEKRCRTGVVLPNKYKSFEIEALIL